jgi:crotonobetainyl-CoA:carnitine CoA-transferase CaiB-like acyl-CoA transferase
MGILMALIERSKSGQGQVIDANLVRKLVNYYFRVNSVYKFALTVLQIDSRNFLLGYVSILDAEIWIDLG